MEWETTDIFSGVEVRPSAAINKACDERGRLVAAYIHAIVQFKRADAVLDGKRPTISRGDYNRLWESVESARLREREAGEALRLHITQHCCS